MISIHALRGEGDATARIGSVSSYYFYPRPPWGGRLEGLACADSWTIFLSTPSVGRATGQQVADGGGVENFYPRPPWGGRRQTHADKIRTSEYFYPRPPWGGRRRCGRYRPLPAWISIHALRGEGDPADQQGARLLPISIHALRGEGDTGQDVPTPEACISIHALRGEGDLQRRLRLAAVPAISIHALRGEGDAGQLADAARDQFLSTPSVGRATAFSRR